MQFHKSPLFIPALWEDESFKVLDETLIPRQIQYVTIKTPSEAVQVVKEMRTRAFGQVLTFYYSVALALLDLQENANAAGIIAELAEDFQRARPTFGFKRLADSLLSYLLQERLNEKGTVLVEKTLRFAERIIRARENRAKRAAFLLPGRCILMTHCNVSGELVEIARAAQAMGKEIEVIATETRPYFQGSRLTAWELSEAGIPTAVIPDVTVAQVLDHGKVNAVLVGSDRCAQNGDVINKIGTYSLAVAAKNYGVPFHVLVQDPGTLQQGSDVTIEERPIEELLTFQGRSYAPRGLEGRYPAFDITPGDFVTSFIGMEDNYTLETFRNRFQKNVPQNSPEERQKKKYLLMFGVPNSESYLFLSQAVRAESANSVLLPEMRPSLVGSRVVAQELVNRGIPTALISDNMMGYFFAERQISKLFLFYSSLESNGPLGISGSLLAALLAQHHAVPIELFQSGNLKGEMEDKDASTFLGERVTPETVSAYSVLQEAIPWSLLKRG